MNQIPEQYPSVRNTLTFDEISIGVGGIRLFKIPNIAAEQVGYSVDPSGHSLVSRRSGGWREHWLVIGNDTATGDPIILDTSNENLAIMSAMHGEGRWDPELIASSLEAFTGCLRIVKDLSKGRENPVRLEGKPISNKEKHDALKNMEKLNGKNLDLSYWETLLEG